jgi:ribonuclease R
VERAARDAILEALRAAGRPLRAIDLARRLGLRDARYAEFRRELRELARSGAILRVRGGRFAAPGAGPAAGGERLGRIAITRGGTAWWAPEAGGPDVFVSARDLASAFAGDRVAVRVVRGRDGRPAARVTRVLERARSELVGRLVRSRDGLALAAVEPAPPRPVLVADADRAGARAGDAVLAEIVDYGDSRRPATARVRERIGRVGERGVDVAVIVRRAGLPAAFPDAVLGAAEALPDAIPEPEIARRADLRELAVVTIDPVDARDHDDALSLVRRPDGALELGVHVADVSHYVRFGDPIDREARARGTSVYLVDRVLPMLPERLSNRLCSLVPGEDRLAVSLRIGLTPRGRILDQRFDDSVIRSHARLAYDEVQRVFDGDAATARRLGPIAGLLADLRQVGAALHARRARRGALDFDLPEHRVELDPDGVPVDVRALVRHESHRLVEECMLLANETVARALRAARVPALYRVHEEPSPDRLSALRERLGRFGYALPAREVRSQDLQHVLREAEGSPEEALVNHLVLRSLARARYAPEPLGHHGLALRDYTHFTSPIRRYPDLAVHRALRALRGTARTPLDPERLTAWLADTAALASARERAADQAERESIDLKKAELLSRHVGETFSGRISGVEAFGCFVTLDRWPIAGLLPLRELPADRYALRPEELALVGLRRRLRFRIGDPLVVRVAAVRPEDREIDFALAEPPAERRRVSPRPRPGRRRRRAAEA